MIVPPVSRADPKGSTSSVVLPFAETVCKSTRPPEAWSESRPAEILRPREVKEEKEGRIETTKDWVVDLRRKVATRGRSSGVGPAIGGKRAFHLGWLTEPRVSSPRGSVSERRGTRRTQEGSWTNRMSAREDSRMASRSRWFFRMLTERMVRLLDIETSGCGDASSDASSGHAGGGQLSKLRPGDLCEGSRGRGGDRNGLRVRGDGVRFRAHKRQVSRGAV